MLDFFHRKPRTVLTPDEREEFYSAGHLALQAYDLLSKRAVASNATLWALKPKIHLLEHHLMRVRESGVLPPWSFPDEDFNGKICKLESVGRCHFRTLGGRIIGRWAFTYGTEVFDDE